MLEMDSVSPHRPDHQQRALDIFEVDAHGRVSRVALSDVARRG